MSNFITVKDILSKKPCSEWTEGRLSKRIGKGKTLLQILNMRNIVPEDRIWCVTKFLDDKTNRAFAIWCARQCKTKVKEIVEYINVIERYYDGKATKKELNAADLAAYRTTYWAAYRAADLAADRTAYWAADSAAERRKQIKKLKKVLGGEKSHE